METKQGPPSDRVTQPGLLMKCWRAFNRWRKRYLWLRLLFLLLLGAFVCTEAFFPLLPKLVGISISAIEAISEPQLVNALSRHRRFRLAHRLQVSLRRACDRNADGVLDETERKRLRELGLEPDKLEKKSVEADLTGLIEACHRAGLLPESYTASAARREARFAAIGEVEVMKRPAREEIEGMLKWWAVPDYSKWETWKRGTNLFLLYLLSLVYAMGTPMFVIVWFFFCFLVVFIVASLMRRRRHSIGLILGGAMALPVVLRGMVVIFFAPYPVVRFYFTLSYFLPALAFLCLSAACGGCAGKAASSPERRPAYLCAAAMGLGILLVYWPWAPRDWVLWYGIPLWVKQATVVAGGVSLIVGVILCSRLICGRLGRKRQR